MNIKKTKLYKEFEKALEINDMRAGANRYVVRCIEIAEKHALTKDENLPISGVRLSCPSDEKVGDIVKEIAYTQKSEEQGDDFIEKVWLLKSWIDENIVQGHEA